MTPLDVSDGIADYLMLPKDLFEYGAVSYQEWTRMKTSASYARP